MNDHDDKLRAALESWIGRDLRHDFVELEAGLGDWHRVEEPPFETFAGELTLSKPALPGAEADLLAAADRLAADLRRAEELEEGVELVHAALGHATRGPVDDDRSRVSVRAHLMVRLR